MNTKIITTALLFFVVAGCTSNAKQDAIAGEKKVSQKTSMKCFKNSSIGSNISKKRCISRKQYEEDKKNSKEQMQRIQNSARPLSTNKEF